MKLPPLSLSAPILCPRCDTPATLADHCIQCALQLRQCGNCRGVAGPFDRYCGFCGFEMLRGVRRSPLWRLWLLLALVPLAAGLGYGVWVARVPLVASQAVTAAVRPTPVPETKPYRAPSLGFNYAVPRDWNAIDYTRTADPAQGLPFVAVSRNPGDQALAQDSRGELLTTRPQATLVALGRPALNTSLVGDPTSPSAVLTSEVAPLVAAPPQGTKIEVARPVLQTTIGDRPAASVVLKVSREGSTYYLELALVYAPRSGSPPMIRAQALVPGAGWGTGDDGLVEGVIRSVRTS